MIIDTNHPYANDIKVYGMNGQIMDGILKVDTDKMEADRFAGFDVTGVIVVIKVPVLRIKGPGIHFSRKISKGRTVNAGKTKTRR